MSEGKKFVIVHEAGKLLDAIWRRYGKQSFTASQFSRDFGLSEIGAVRVLNKMAKMGLIKKIGYRRYVLKK